MSQRAVDHRRQPGASVNTRPDVELFLRGAKSEENGFGFSRCTDRQIFTRPTLLCCGGELTSGGCEANGFAKLILDSLGCTDVQSADTRFQTASVVYDPACSVGQSYFYNRGQVDKERFAQFVDCYLAPLFLQNDRSPLAVDAVKRNFRNINVVAHSFGAAFIQQIGDVLFDRMEKAGFNHEEIDAAASQILVVTTGAAVNYMRSKANFTFVHVLHRHDMEVKERTSNVDLLTSFAPSFDSRIDLVGLSLVRGNNDWDIRLRDGARTLIIGTINEKRPDTDRIVVSAAQEGEILGISQDLRIHNDGVYYRLSLSQYGFMLPTIIASVLTNGLNNSIMNLKCTCELPKPQELVLLPQELPHLSPSWNFIKIAKMVDYESRIKEMLVEASE
jgi:hypothetical protein